MRPKLPISLAIFLKNEEMSIRDCIESVKPIVSEIIIVDTGSTDRTLDICRKYTDKIYKVGFSDFGSIRTLAAHLATQPWVLMLDADERLASEDWDKVTHLICQPNEKADTNSERSVLGQVAIDSWALPRKRWADKWMRIQVDVESYPDWQVRLFRNHSDKRIGFKRRVHETIYGCVRTEQAMDGPTIHHFQGIYKPVEHTNARANFYKQLYEQDIAEGIEHTEPPVIDIDKHGD